MFSLFGKRGKKDEPATDAAASPAPPAPVTSEPPAASSAPAAATASNGAPSPTASAPGWPETSDADASFTPPNTSSLNLDALFAPPPADTPASNQPAIGPKDEARTEALKPKIVEALSTIYDPEIPVNIYELGLIYDVIVDSTNNVGVRMTLTSPACPSAQQLPSEARYKVKAVEGVTDCAVDIVWDPPWTKDMMSEAAKLSLGIF